MPTYNYKCTKCEHIQEESHRMSESPQIRCCKCQSECHKTFDGVNITTWVRGNGIVKDRAGAKRDMNLYHLTQDDPYGIHRAPGEREQLATSLRSGGKFKKNPVIFTSKKKR